MIENTLDHRAAQQSSNARSGLASASTFRSRLHIPDVGRAPLGLILELYLRFVCNI